MSPPTVKEVAERAGVSAGTVSNVLNRPEIVNEPTRTRVLDAIKELGFVRNGSARALRVGRSHTIGMLVVDVANPFFIDVAHGVDAVVERNGSMLMLVDLANSPARQRRALAQLEEVRAQGVLVTPFDDKDDPLLDEFAERGVPMVLLYRRQRDVARCCVSVDDVVGGRLAIDHLLQQGHEHLAFVGGPFAVPWVADRQKGSSDAVAAAGGSARLDIIETPTLTIRSGLDAGQRLASLPRDERPTAIFCANDLVSLGALQAFTSAGLRVPEDVAIVGYDDIDFAAGAAVPLSSVRQPREDIGRAAAELLFEEIASPIDHQHREVVFQPELVVRASSQHVVG